MLFSQLIHISMPDGVKAPHTWDERHAAMAAFAVASRVLPSLTLSSAAFTAASTCSVASLAACKRRKLDSQD